MELNRARYLSGAAFHARTIYRKGGGRVHVFDRTKRWRQVGRAMRRAGFTDLQIAVALRVQRPLLEQALSFSWRF